MSSILEALEKADEERGLHPRELKSVSSKSKQGRLNPRLIAGAVALIILVNIAVWLFFLRDESEPVVQQKSASGVKAPVVKPEPPVTQRHAIVTKPAAKPVVSVPEQLKRTTRPSAKPLIEEAVVKKSQARPKPTRAVESQAVEEEQVAVSPAEVGQPVIQESPKPGVIKIPKPMERAVVQPKLKRPALVMAPPLEPVKRESVAAEPEVSEEEKIPLVWELPQNLRERVLQLQSSIHVYSESPEERFVIINMKRYQEGDSLTSDGFRLQRIDRNGIVIDYGSGLVRLERR
jgi:general secretion pathway protein B